MASKTFDRVSGELKLARSLAYRRKALDERKRKKAIEKGELPAAADVNDEHGSISVKRPLEKGVSIDPALVEAPPAYEHAVMQQR